MRKANKNPNPRIPEPQVPHCRLSVLPSPHHMVERLCQMASGQHVDGVIAPHPRLAVHASFAAGLADFPALQAVLHCICLRALLLAASALLATPARPQHACLQACIARPAKCKKGNSCRAFVDTLPSLCSAFSLLAAEAVRIMQGSSDPTSTCLVSFCDSACSTCGTPVAAYCLRQAGGWWYKHLPRSAAFFPPVSCALRPM